MIYEVYLEEAHFLRARFGDYVFARFSTTNEL